MPLPSNYHDLLFLIYHEFVEPEPKVERFLSNKDIIEAAVRSLKGENTLNYDPKTDLFTFEGMGWCMRDTYYLARKINTDHPHALQWLQERGYDIEGRPMGWMYEFVFNSGRSLRTAHRWSLSTSPRLWFNNTPFVVLDTALVNLNRVVHYSSYYANMDLLSAKLDKTPPR